MEVEFGASGSSKTDVTSYLHHWSVRHFEYKKCVIYSAEEGNLECNGVRIKQAFQFEVFRGVPRCSDQKGLKLVF